MSATPAMAIAPVTLTGSVVRLEPLAMGHCDALCAVGLDPELWAVTMTLLRTPHDMRAYIEEAVRLREAGLALPFAIVEMSTGTVVGSTRFANIDQANRRLEIGWTWVARPWQRTAVNTETKLLLLAHAFESLGAIRVEFKTDAINARSRAALARIGATEEGILRHHMIAPGGRLRDSVYFSILRPEWDGVKARLTERLARGRAPGGISQ
jgi:RimJ/RimL family protein N-acetyltransferase